MTDPLERELAEVRASRRRILDAADSDRRDIERTLHDGLQQDLVALSANLQLLSTHVDGSPEAVQLLNDLKQAALDAHQHASELAQALHPPLLEARGLASVIRAAASQAGIVVEVEVADRDSYPSAALNAMYWVCVDALATALRASHASVALGHVGRALTFEVAIQGQLDEVRLERLRDRVQALGGEVAVRDISDGHSTIYGTLPSA